MKQSEVFEILAVRDLDYRDYPIECTSEANANKLAERISSKNKNLYHVVKVASTLSPWLVIQHEEGLHFSNETITGSYLEGKKLDL